jgi:hypothetical protein
LLADGKALTNGNLVDELGTYDFDTINSSLIGELREDLQEPEPYDWLVPFLGK